MISDIKRLFNEFISLSDKTWDGNINVKNEDIPIADFTIVRYSEDGITIHFLYNGTNLFISKDWRNIFSSFNVYLGSRIDYLNTNLESLDTVDKTIFVLTKIFILLDKKLNNSQGSELLNLLGDLCDLGTGIFISWVEKEHNLVLSSPKLTTINGQIMI